MNRAQVFAAGGLVLCLVCVWTCEQALAQQPYRQGSVSYGCTDTVNKSCNSFVLYRTRNVLYNRAVYIDVPAVANLFAVNETAIAQLNDVSVDQNLGEGRPLLVPVPCSCVNASSMYLLKYVIKQNDTFWNLFNNTFEGLASTRAILDANKETEPTALDIGQVVNVPIRCACPTVAQLQNGTITLMTYTIQGGDTVFGLAASFGVQPDEILAANSLGEDQLMFPQDTLIIPYKVSEPSLPLVPSTTPRPPPPPPVAAPTPPPSGKSSTNVGVYVAIGVGVCAAILIGGLCVTVFIARKRRRTRASHRLDPKGGLGIPQPLPSSSNNGGQSPHDFDHGGTRPRQTGDLLAGMFDVMDNDKPTFFTLDEIRDATNNFSPTYRIQGSVYRGILRGQTVAIKQTKVSMSEELKILCRVHHTNLIKLVGLCVTEAEHMYLVYEYAENGSLSDCLHTDFMSRNKLATKSSSFLSWPVRIQIALDVATGLEYIHDYINPSYVHKDVKSSNILLDGVFRAKIANFAMAKSGGSNAMMTRHIAGTYGYMAPEYLAHGLVTPKADVFAFGVTLLELLSAQEAVLEDENGQEKSLYTCIGPILEGDDQTVKENLRKWIDPVLQTNYPLDIARQLAYLARSCVENDPTQRPGMKDITYALSNLLAASLEWESSAVFAHTLLEIPIEAR